ncbi:hypothetical protein [Homoserinibacter sp. YIM 151385]|uniref:hypothetical protein n=1 Tax=Homoserinibacter sp. YIM 151385 TaxID=2985506 RepID=UPI0022F09ABB|nr:hypothetical protein [Homoserinibacter sp. YIM 151385]WBU37928.1 hypothetical protein OF852_13590 [Homoserinibacter sp. YIM 151385]
MTILDRTRTEIAASETHPSLGSAGAAEVSPVTATLYRVTFGDDIVGYIDYVEPLWIAYRGTRSDLAVESGQHRSMVLALRELTARA